MMTLEGVDWRNVREVFKHILGELGIENLSTSLVKCDYDKLRKAHNSIHMFIYIPVLCFPEERRDVSWHQHSAFIIYQWEAFYTAHRALIEALSGYYNAAYSLLRVTLELILKGALWECLAHRKYRDSAWITRTSGIKVDSCKITLLDWFNDIFKLNPRIEDEFERISASIYDKIYPLLENPELGGLINRIRIRDVIKQLFEWGILRPVENPDTIYEMYRYLSREVHVMPNRTDIGRRILCGGEPFNVELLVEELEKLFEQLNRLMDIGIIVELNILEDWINGSERVKDKLKKIVPDLKGLQLINAVQRINML